MGDDLDLIQARMMNFLKLEEDECSKFLFHVLDMGPEYVPEDSCLRENDKVLNSTLGDDWIFAFEKKGHLDGAQVRQLIEEEVSVFRKRVFIYDVQDKAVFKFASQKSRIHIGEATE